MTLASEAGLDAVDRAISRAAAASASWRSALLDDPEHAAPPLEGHREVAGMTAFRELGQRSVVSQEVELRDALSRWVAVLTVRRVTETAEADLAKALVEKLARLDLEPVRHVSFREAWRGVVRSKGRAEANAWLDAAAQRGEAVSAARRELFARQAEAVSRLGYGSWSELAGGTAPASLGVAGEAFLRETDDLAEALRREAHPGDRELAQTVAGSILEAVARDAPDGLPARLTLRTLMGTMGPSEEGCRGLRLDINLPGIIGASSFARALSAFGVAFRRAAPLAGRPPFVLASDPALVDAHRFGFVFGGLAMDPVFHRRGLGVVSRIARQQARSLAKTALLHARTVALAALLGPSSTRADAARFEELTHRVFGQALPRALSGAFPAFRLDHDPRLEALLTSLPFARDLRERFDEDWFRNPGAWRSLRARASGPALLAAEKPEPETLARAFEEALG